MTSLRNFGTQGRHSISNTPSVLWCKAALHSSKNKRITGKPSLFFRMKMVQFVSVAQVIFAQISNLNLIFG